MKRLLLATTAVALLSGGVAHARVQSQGEEFGGYPGENLGEAYRLGEVVVTARDRMGRPAGGAVIRADDIERFGRTSVDQALDLLPGVSAVSTGGSRNERYASIRGFDRFQTTLSIDGVRVFLPADNRVDLARFLTADLSQVQVAKGYVSVLDGPGAMGGAINLVTRRPTQSFEGEVGVGVEFDNRLQAARHAVTARVGGASQRGYAQISGVYAERGHWSLPRGFEATTLEDGGRRDFSDTVDWRINLKVGLTPNQTDEYSVTYTRQEGSKNAPYHVGDGANTRYWNWPEWNVDSLALITRTQVTERATLEGRLYRNTFYNALFAYDDASQTSQTQRRAFQSYYEDEAIGGDLRLALALTPVDTLRVAMFLREDEHVEWQTSFAPSLSVEPRQTTLERTASIALEHTRSFGPALDLVLGVSRDSRDLRKAQDYNAGVMLDHPLTDDAATNAQAMVIYRAGPGLKLHAGVSSRSRFPTLFERFSSRFGASVPNPSVRSERAINYELGVRREIEERVQIEGAVFYSDLKDMLVQVPVDLGPPFGVTKQTRNAGDGRLYGVEASVRVAVSPRVSAGGNYTYVRRELETPSEPGFRPTGTPSHKGFAWLRWTPAERLAVTPSLEAWSGLWTYAVVPPQGYYETDSVILTHLTAEVALTPAVDLIFGARNLFDATYMLTDGYPEAGRSVRLDLKARF